MTKFFASMAAIAIAITFSSCASKDEPTTTTGSTYQGSSTSTYSK